MIEGRYILTVDDLVEGGRAAFASNRTVLRFRLQWFVVGVGIIVIVLNQKPSPLYWLLLLAGFFFWVALGYPGRHFRDHFQKSVTNEEVTVQIDSNGVTTVSASDRSEIKWKGFRLVIDTPTTFSLVTIQNGLLVVPKRALSAQSCEEFRNLIAVNNVSLKPRSGSAS